MLIRFKIENFEAFNEEVELNLEADLRTKKLSTNIIQHPQGNILKSAVLYGPNNTGKTCLVKGMKAYQDFILNKPKDYKANVFTNSPIYKLGAIFMHEGIRYNFSLNYDTKTKTIVEEDFKELKIDKHGNETTKSYFYRNTETKIFESSCEKLMKVIGVASKDNILIYTLDTEELELLKRAKEVLIGFANKIAIISTNRVEPYKTIEMLKDIGSKESKQIAELIKSADLNIEDFKYDKEFVVNITDLSDNDRSKNLRDEEKYGKFIELLSLVSIQKGKSLPSIVYDSLGTKKIVSLAGYIVDAINNGKILIIDELDAGIHFKLSRNIVSLFNSIKNEKAQLVFTTHDVSLMDIKVLFRKEQIWFTDKDEKRVYLYPLSDFTAENSGIRNDTNIYEYYSKGLLGALQEPSLVDMLLMDENSDAYE